MNLGPPDAFTKLCSAAFYEAGLDGGLCYMDGDMHRFLTPSVFYDGSAVGGWLRRYAASAIAQAEAGRDAADKEATKRG